MPVPPEPIIRAASRWLTLLDISSRERSFALLSTAPSLGDLTLLQYEAAYDWLREIGLSSRIGSLQEVPRTLFDAVLQTSELNWLRDSDRLVRDEEEIPQDVSGVADALGLAPNEALAAIRVQSGKVNTAERERVGNAGEIALVELLQSHMVGEVSHVAAFSDGYGYDIAVSVGTLQIHVEVKATTRQGRAVIFLSRHEFEVMKRDPCWILVLVRLGKELDIQQLHSVPNDWISRSVPSDSSSYGRWQSVALEVPECELIVGMPALEQHIPNSPLDLSRRKLSSA